MLPKWWEIWSATVSGGCGYEGLRKISIKNHDILYFLYSLLKIFHLTMKIQQEDNIGWMLFSSFWFKPSLC